ncbi:MAG TPA: hypothetical protein DD982_02460 [Thalassospira sp.]|jgi:hypothetical protein|nr:hypothetical protein [Thalassospira sp.]
MLAAPFFGRYQKARIIGRKGDHASPPVARHDAIPDIILHDPQYCVQVAIRVGMLSLLTVDNLSEV